MCERIIRGGAVVINSVQRFLYVLGTVSPYALVASLCYGLQVAADYFAKWAAVQPANQVISSVERLKILIEGVPAVSWILAVLSVMLIMYHVMFLNIVLKKLSPMDFLPESTPEENDGFAKGLGVTYVLPIIEWLITKNIFAIDERTSGVFLLIIGICAVIVSLFANKSYGSPVYLIAGYHFHIVRTATSKSYILMSKRKNYRNKGQVKRVVRLFEDLLIDVT